MRNFNKHQKRKVNKKELALFLDNLGFETNRVEEHNLNVIAFGKYEQKEAIFKLSSTKENSKRLQNEYNWNEAVHRIPDKKHPSFTIPQNLSCGRFNELFYLIAEKFPNSVLSEGDLESYLHKLAKVTLEIRNLDILKNSEFFIAQMNKNPKKASYSLLEAAKEWARQIPVNLDHFLNILERSKDSLRFSPGHGGFELKHMFVVGNKIGLIDGELAGILGVMYYDAAFFYMRLRNDFTNHLFAQQYLHKVYNLLPKDEQKTFWEEIRFPLIVRYIGDLWGVTGDKRKLVDLELVGADILKDKISKNYF